MEVAFGSCDGNKKIKSCPYPTDTSLTAFGGRQLCIQNSYIESPVSIRPLIEEHVLSNDIPNRKALHVGCGSSTVGEFLLDELNFDLVVDLDKDQETMEKMKHRWDLQQKQTATATPQSTERSRKKKIEFCILDFTQEPIPYPDNFFGFILDKSTLDCTLCSDNATASLLIQVYNKLAVDGVYLLISFHENELLIPLLSNMPGTHWDITCTTMDRQVENLITTSNNSTAVDQEQRNDTWNPSKKPLNVIIARKLQSSSNENNSNNDDDLYESVCRHVHQVNDDWFQQHQPLVTRARTQELKDCFADSSKLELEHAYTVMFTEAEREHLTYEHFLEDWQAFKSDKEDVIGTDTTQISFDLALAFLNEMQ